MPCTHVLIYMYVYVLVPLFIAIICVSLLQFSCQITFHCQRLKAHVCVFVGQKEL